MDRGKRQRLSGSQFKKIRLQREAKSAKQKNALLQFLSSSSNEKSPTVASNQNEDEIEIEGGGEIEYADIFVEEGESASEGGGKIEYANRVIEDRDSTSENTAKEPENVDEVEFISNLSEVVVQNVDNIGQNENNEDQSGGDSKIHKN